MSGMVDPNVEAEIEIRHEVELFSSLEMCLGAQPTHPPHSLLERGITMSNVSGLVDVPESTSGFHRIAIHYDVIAGGAVAPALC